uniref:Uncharacterized protein n=1 Tax=Glossina austeni TaxID=7395 RepID=A0A1A9UE28_GLOAU
MAIKTDAKAFSMLVPRRLIATGGTFLLPILLGRVCKYRSMLVPRLLRTLLRDEILEISDRVSGLANGAKPNQSSWIKSTGFGTSEALRNGGNGKCGLHWDRVEDCRDKMLFGIVKRGEGDLLTCGQLAFISKATAFKRCEDVDCFSEQSIFEFASFAGGKGLFRVTVIMLLSKTLEMSHCMELNWLRLRILPASDDVLLELFSTPISL